MKSLVYETPIEEESGAQQIEEGLRVIERVYQNIIRLYNEFNDVGDRHIEPEKNRLLRLTVKKWLLKIKTFSFCFLGIYYLMRLKQWKLWGFILLLLSTRVATI